MQTRAMSWGVPTLLDGCCRWSVSLTSSGLPVWIQPGDMQLTVIPNSESDIMREWVRDATPPLLAEYASVPVSLWMWREEEMQIMRPPKSDGKG